MRLIPSETIKAFTGAAIPQSLSCHRAFDVRKVRGNRARVFDIKIERRASLTRHSPASKRKSNIFASSKLDDCPMVPKLSPPPQQHLARLRLSSARANTTKQTEMRLSREAFIAALSIV